MWIIEKIKNWFESFCLYFERDDIKEIEKQIRLITKDPYDWE